MISPKSVTVVVDSREKYPLLFPETLVWHPDRAVGSGSRVRVRVDVRKLDHGDYLLAKWPGVAIVERKASLEELCQNLLTDDFARFTHALDRLRAGCRFPYVLVEEGPSSLLTPSHNCQCPARVMDAFYAACARRGIGVWMVGRHTTPDSRRKLGEHVVRLLLGHALHSSKESA